MVAACTAADRAAIGCPFGWPEPFVAALVAHQAGQPWLAPTDAAELAHDTAVWPQGRRERRRDRVRVYRVSRRGHHPRDHPGQPRDVRQRGAGRRAGQEIR